MTQKETVLRHEREQAWSKLAESKSDLIRMLERGPTYGELDARKLQDCLKVIIAEVEFRKHITKIDDCDTIDDIITRNRPESDIDGEEWKNR
jgi:hypothetical protein